MPLCCCCCCCCCTQRRCRDAAPTPTRPTTTTHSLPRLAPLRYQLLCHDSHVALAERLQASNPDRFIYHPSKWSKFADGTDNIELGGFTPSNKCVCVAAARRWFRALTQTNLPQAPRRARALRGVVPQQRRGLGAVLRARRAARVVHRIDDDRAPLLPDRHHGARRQGRGRRHGRHPRAPLLAPPELRAAEPAHHLRPAHPPEPLLPQQPLLPGLAKLHPLAQASHRAGPGVQALSRHRRHRLPGRRRGQALRPHVLPPPVHRVRQGARLLHAAPAARLILLANSLTLASLSRCATARSGS